MSVGGEHALTATVKDHDVEYQWHGEWAKWEELHGHPLIKDLANKSVDLLARAGKGMKGGTKGKGRGSGPH